MDGDLTADQVYALEYAIQRLRSNREELVQALMDAFDTLADIMSLEAELEERRWENDHQQRIKERRNWRRSLARSQAGT